MVSFRNYNQNYCSLLEIGTRSCDYIIIAGLVE